MGRGDEREGVGERLRERMMLEGELRAFTKLMLYDFFVHIVAMGLTFEQLHQWLWARGLMAGFPFFPSWLLCRVEASDGVEGNGLMSAQNIIKSIVLTWYRIVITLVVDSYLRYLITE